MTRNNLIAAFVLMLPVFTLAQSGRVTGYSESESMRLPSPPEKTASPLTLANSSSADTDVVRVPTDLVTIPVRISTTDGRPVRSVARQEFAVFENGVQQEIAYFSNDEQPFTVALVLDMSYSTVFKVDDIRTAARIFTLKLRPHDRVSVIAFDENPQVLCDATNDRRVLHLAIDGAKVGSGTALYDALEMAIDSKLSNVPGRRAIVLLTDGVDTSSTRATATALASRLAAEDIIVYTLHYNTFADVTKNRQKNAEIRFDENDRSYVVQRPPEKGERVEDYAMAHSFLRIVSEQTGGRIYRVSSTTNLNAAFSNIADELRKIYSIGYYPQDDRLPGEVYDIKVRVYRPNLKITARSQFLGK